MQRRSRIQPLLLALAVLGLAAACLSPDPAPARRYFEPSPLEDGAGLEGFNVDMSARAGYLSETTMVWRVAPGELAFDEDRRWVESPAQLTRRRMHAWGAPRRTNVGRALYVDVDAFEGVMGAPPLARLALDVTRSDDDARRVVYVEVPLARASAEELARGMGAALDDALGQIRDWVSEGP